MPRTPAWRLSDLPAYEAARNQLAMAAVAEARVGAVVDAPWDRRASVDGFDRPVVDALLTSADDAPSNDEFAAAFFEGAGDPTLTVLLGSIGGGRSRALARVTRGARPPIVLNAEDIATSAHGVEGRDANDGSTAAELQGLLARARTDRRSVALEGVFRSPALVSGMTRLFAEAAFTTRLVAIADSAAEVRMGATSLGLSYLRARGTPDLAPSFAGVGDLLDSLSVDSHVHRVTVFDRAGALVLDATEPQHRAEAAARYRDAARLPLGTLRSLQWLSELRHMGRFVAERQSAPAWVLQDLGDLHEIALREILPALPVPPGSDALQIQTARLRRGLALLRSASTDPTPSVTPATTAAPAQPDGRSRSI